MKTFLIALLAFCVLSWPKTGPVTVSSGFIAQSFAKDKDDDKGKNKNEDEEDKDKDEDKDPKQPPTVPEPSAALQYGAGALALLAIAYFLKRSEERRVGKE